MTVPRTRRYPRRPTIKHIGASPADMNALSAILDAGDPMPTDAMIATALTQRYGKRAAHAWTTNLTPTSPALPPERRSKPCSEPEGSEPAQKRQRATQRPKRLPPREVTMLYASDLNAGYASPTEAE